MKTDEWWLKSLEWGGGERYRGYTYADVFPYYELMVKLKARIKNQTMKMITGLIIGNLL